MARLTTFLFVALAGMSGAADAAIVTLVPSRDNTLFQESGDLSNGAGPGGFTGRTLNGFRRRMLLRFDLGAIPAGATITRAELTLSMSRTISGNAVVRLHRVSADWGEAGSNAGPLGGNGAPAQNGDATWTQRFWPATPWTTPGGDFAALESASQIVGDVGSYTFGSTPAMVADVAGWRAAPATNFGWIVVADENASAPTAKRFDSREFADPAFRPQLLVEFDAPAPLPVPSLGTWAAGLLALALMLLAARRGRAPT